MVKRTIHNQEEFYKLVDVLNVVGKKSSVTFYRGKISEENICKIKDGKRHVFYINKSGVEELEQVFKKDIKSKLIEDNKPKSTNDTTDTVKSLREKKNMNNIQIFNNSELGEIRVVEINKEPWFVGKDVAEILGYSNTRDALLRHVDKEDNIPDVVFHDGSQNRKMTVINESGLYSLILSSKLPKAKEFKRWVTSEVLPSIRKHGAYMTPETIEKAINDPDFTIGLLNALKSERDKRIIAEKENEIMKPKVAYLERIMNSNMLYTATEIAKDYGMSSMYFNSLLHELGIQFKVNGQWILYQKYAKNNYTKSVTFEDKAGLIRTTKRWTPRGVEFLYYKLKEKGYIPNSETEDYAVACSLGNKRS